jgi:hypothetical protein
MKAIFATALLCIAAACNNGSNSSSKTETIDSLKTSLPPEEKKVVQDTAGYDRMSDHTPDSSKNK